MTEHTPDKVSALGDALRTTASTVYNHGPWCVAISLAWVLASSPIVTIGPATVGAHVALRTLREGYRVDVAEVISTVRAQFVPAMLLGLFPVVLAGATAVNVLGFLQARTLGAEVLLFIVGYATLYAVLIAMPAFVKLSEGMESASSIWYSVRWTASNPTLALTTGLLTLTLLALSILLTVAFVLLFPAVAFTFHALAVGRSDSQTTTSQIAAPSV